MSLVGEKKCPRCGRTYKDFLDSFLFGCEECYTVFEKELLPVLMKCQGADRHYKVESDEKVEREFAADGETELLWVRYDEYSKAGNDEDAENVLSLINRLEENKRNGLRTGNPYKDSEIELLQDAYKKYEEAGNYEDAAEVMRMIERIKEGENE